MTRYAFYFENNRIRYAVAKNKNGLDICMERKLPYDYRVKVGAQNTYSDYIRNVTEMFIEQIVIDGTDFYFWWSDYMKWCVSKNIVPVDDILELACTITDTDWYKSNLDYEEYIWITE